MTPNLMQPRDLLDFYAEAGVDAVVGETPNDYLTAPAPAPPPPATSRPTQPMPAREREVKTAAAVPAAPDAAVMAAREAAKSAASLDELRALLDAFEGCALKATASRLVFADGDIHARLRIKAEQITRRNEKIGHSVALSRLPVHWRL